MTALTLDRDYHVHSTFSDGVSTVTENVSAAERLGLRLLCLTDHVRRQTSWLPEFVSAVRALRQSARLEVLAGVEAKILDRAGELDLPGELDGIDLILIADHQFPGGHGPVDPVEMRTLIGRGLVPPAVAIGALIDATSRALAMSAGRQALIAHLFSILPKMGLSESAVPDGELDRLARRAADTGALLEVNEKWACPSARTVSVFARAGVAVVPGSDSHDCQDVGRFATVSQTMAAVSQAAGAATAGEVT